MINFFCRGTPGDIPTYRCEYGDIPTDPIMYYLDDYRVACSSAQLHSGFCSTAASVTKIQLHNIIVLYMY